MLNIDSQNNVNELKSYGFATNYLDYVKCVEQIMRCLLEYFLHFILSKFGSHE